MERGYHIGYMMCQSPEVSASLRIPPASQLAYLGGTGCLLSPGWDDAQEFLDCQAALMHVGLPAEHTANLWRVLCGVLLLGELDFGSAEAAEAAVADRSKLEHLCELIEVDADAMSRALTIKMTKMGSEWVTSPNTPARASELRHGFARSMYSTVFDWLVTQINRSLRMDVQGTEGDDAGSASSQFIGILDIFGFETFGAGNSLEQLCINFCNERLQATFNEAIFKAVQEENAAEGVELPDADLSEIDNSATVQLIGGRPGGILHSLNEECIVPKGSDASFLDKLLESHKGSQLLKKSLKVQEGFVVTHFVGEVTYVATGFLLKNKDPVSEDLMVLLQRSRSTFVQGLFATNSETKSLLAKRKDTRFQGVVSKFQKQLEELLRLIGYSHMHFVRCIKPNREKVPSVFEDDLVAKQLRCSGVFEAVRVIGLGYPDRLPHFTIIGQFARLLPEDDRPEVDEEGNLELTEPEAVLHVLTKLGESPDSFALGISKVFLKAGVLPRLRQLQQDQAAEIALVMQAAARGFLGRKAVLVRREERQRQLEEEAAAALAEAMRAEAEALEAASALEAAAAAAASAAAAEDEAEAASFAAAQADALNAALRAGKSRDEKKASATEAIAEVESARRTMLHGAVLGGDSLAESQLRAKMRLDGSSGLLPIDTAAAAAAAAESEDQKEDEENQKAKALLTRRTESRRNLLGAEDAEDGTAQRSGGTLSLGLASLGAPNLSINTSMLSHRAQGGGVAPLSSARAPQRKDVKKVANRKKKDAQWMDMVLEYAVYLGMDPEVDGELLWIAEQALRAPVPVGWEEMMDPFGDLYFFNETTSQSTRQHPMDGYYQQLYLKLRLQKAGGFAVEEAPPPAPPPEQRTKTGPGGNRRGKGRDSAAKQPETSRLLQRGGNETNRGEATNRWRRASLGTTYAGALGKGAGGGDEDGSFLTSRGGLTARGSILTARGGSTARGGLTARDGQPRHVISSVSEALEMASPRTAKFMLERFGLTDESTEDERCLLINPAVWSLPAQGGEVPFIECLVDKDELGMGLNRLSLFMCLNDNNEAFALGALKRMVNQNTMYELSMSENDDEVDVHYTGKLSCNARGNEFVMYDDANDAIGIREGKARRELGLVLFGQQQLGQTLPIELIVPRVQRDGQCAQFRPKALAEAMIQQYKSGKTKHLFVLKGLAHLVPGGRVQLKFRGGEHSAVVFEAYRHSGDRWAVRYRHPLSAFQAFNVTVALLHNPMTQVLD